MGQLTLESFMERGLAAQAAVDDMLAKGKARATDPESSHIAARAIVKSGEIGRQQTQVLELVRQSPGSTSHELSDGNAALRYVIARRLPELARLQLVVRGPVRACRITDRLATTWSPF